MSPAITSTRHNIRPGDPGLATRLRKELQGEVLFDAFSRGRYSTDASIYQIEPLGVVVPRSVLDIEAAISIARDQGLPVLPRGAGTSQSGQTVGEALVIDTSKYLNNLLELDQINQRVRVQPGVVLDQLNARLRPHGLFYPIDVSPANRATIGGMTGNNSCGSRSIRYGNMVHNVRAIRALLADGSSAEFAHTPGNLSGLEQQPRHYLDLVQRMRALAKREAREIDERIPKLLRRVGGYNIDSINPQGHNKGHNMASLLVGSEGTLGFFTEIELQLQPLPTHRVLGICHFADFRQAMESVQHIVKLSPSAVELVDHTLIELSRQIELFRPTVERFVQGQPEALLLVEFAGDDHQEVLRQLAALGELMADLGHGDNVVQATEPKFQQAVWEVRKAGLNIMMSMKGDGKPVSFVEDCSVRLEDLADYTERLTAIFARHGTRGTWYAHASVGTLHVRPIINLKSPAGAKQMRAVAEDCFAMVREYKGSHSGEHGDGLVRSEFHEAMFGTQICRTFEEVKDAFDPKGMFNPGKIVHPQRMDDRQLFRYKPNYQAIPVRTGLDWSEWGGFDRAIEMCNNNGTCRKSDPGVMCPSYRVTRDEQHLTRGRANSLRLALTGQLGPDALTSDELYKTLELCVGCKACKRECPTGVDMARMKIEFLYQYHQRHPMSMSERLVAWLPRYAPLAAKVHPLMNLRNYLPPLAWLQEQTMGFSARRSLPRWHANPFRDAEAATPATDREIVLLADTFNRWFEPENLRAAVAVLAAGGYQIHIAASDNSERPLCCGRTFLAAGQIDEARVEAKRMVDAVLPYARRGIPILGLEPSCLFTLRDEFKALLPGGHTDTIARYALLLEEFLDREHQAGRLQLKLHPIEAKHALLHGHCHQKAFASMDAVQHSLELVPDLDVEIVQSSCCGMAGAFGYQADHYAVSMQMAELDLLPAVRKAQLESLIVAGGTSCRHQIQDGSDRLAHHPARILQRAL